MRPGGVAVDSNNPHLGRDQRAWLNPHSAAEYIGTPARTLEMWRHTGTGPRYTKAGRRVLYRRDWIDEWLENRSVTSTAEAKSRRSLKEQLARRWVGRARESSCVCGVVLRGREPLGVMAARASIFSLLSAALAAGRAHVESATNPGRPPAGASDAKAVGWRLDPDGMTWRSQGDCVGWWADDGIYLEPEAAYAEAQKLGGATGEPVGVGSATLHRRLYQRGLLVSTEYRGGQRRLTARKSIGGKRRQILHVAHDLSPYPQESGPSGPAGPIDEILKEEREVE
jgi:helix-turn-helix protein